MAACSRCVGQHFQPQLGSIRNLPSLEPQAPRADLGEGSALQPNDAQQNLLESRRGKLFPSKITLLILIQPSQGYKRSVHPFPSPISSVEVYSLSGKQ